MKPAPEEDKDALLFREAMAGVRRRPDPAHLGPPKSRATPQARQREADDRAVIAALLAEPDPEMESGDTLSYRASGIQDAVLRRLRRGHYRLERELDLHGMNRDQARAAVGRFLQFCRDHNLRCVRIIHGKGNGSPNSGPVLKTQLESWLRRARDVLAFCSARPVDGGTGAVYVLLRAGDGPARA